MKIRAVCTDIDGTLLDSRRELSPRTIAAFKRIPSSVPIILASSRMPSAMTHLQRELGIVDHPLICYNGGYAVHYRNRTDAHIFCSAEISLAISASILTMVESTSIHISLYQADQWYAPALDYWTDREQRITKVSAKIMDNEKVIQRWIKQQKGAHKIMCMGPEADIDNMEKQLLDAFSDQIHIYRSRPTYLELAPRTVSKATALKIILEKEFNIELSETIAFGDNFNDIDLIQQVGLGVAVGNARPEVKSVAKEITTNSVDDGVAITIEKYF